MKIQIGKSITKIFTVCILFISVFSTVNPALVSGERRECCNILYVGGDGPGNYTTICDALSSSRNGDIIYVYSGLYLENLYVSKSVKLVGENRYSTIIDGQRKGEVITTVEPVDNFTISGFTIRNGIYGIGLYSCSNITICGNIICNNRYAGIWMDSSCNSEISNNTIRNNSFYGIWLDYHSNCNLIRDNTIKNNQHGIFISSSCENKIVSNNFIENSIHASFDNASDNQWEKNYWDDWIGIKYRFMDNLPKCIGGSVNGTACFNFDRHPVKKPYLHSSILYVGGTGDNNYTCINDALSVAEDGDTIYVSSGIYREALHVKKSISIIGESANSTIIDGEGMGSVFEIVADRVIISNLTVRNGSYGITLFSSSSCTICENIVENNKYDGIWLDLSSDNLICNNIIMKNKYNGILIIGGHHNVIEGNTICSNGEGMILGDTSHSEIHYNNFANNGINAYFVNSSETSWLHNYWNDWIGLKCAAFRFFPKIIWGKLKRNLNIPFIDFDWKPLSKPFTTNI